MSSNVYVQTQHSRQPSPSLSCSSDHLPSYYSTQPKPSTSTKYPLQTRFSSLIFTTKLFGPYKVCLKVFRPLSLGCAQTENNCYKKEIEVWKKLHHPNLVPMLGLISSPVDYTGVIVPWYDKGTAPEYLKTTQGDNILPMLLDIAEGIKYLHENLIVHGDLKGANVFIDDDNRAVLTDFGIAPRLQAEIDATSDPLPSLRWLAPELFLDSVNFSYSTDIYAVGCTFLELLTGEQPYGRLTEGEVVRKVLQRCSPEETASPFRYHASVSQRLNQLLHACWSPPPDRPSIREMTELLREIKARDSNSDEYPPPYSLPPSPITIRVSNEVF